MIADYFTETFKLKVQSESTTFPYDISTCTCTTFYGALATISGNERFLDRQITGEATHYIDCPDSVSLTRKQRIGYGTRSFEVIIPKKSYIRKGHHQLIICKEIT